MVVKNKGRHKTFQANVSGEVSPLSFDIYEEEFNCYPSLQGAVLLEFIAASDDDGGAAAKQILTFFERALEPESWERFRALINDPQKIVDLELLTEIIGWLVEEYTSRPTTAS